MHMCTWQMDWSREADQEAGGSDASDTVFSKEKAKGHRGSTATTTNSSITSAIWSNFSFLEEDKDC